MKKNIFSLILLSIFTIIWIFLAINPSYRTPWIVENVILIVFLAILILSYRKFQFSNISYFMIFIFAILQTIGAHYTYAEVPIGFWLQNMFDFSRNHYDRIAHFCFGFLLAYPFREFMNRTSELRTRFWTYYFPVEMAFASGAVYEIIEWLFAVFSGDQNLGDQFLGHQGDIWDAQIDMFLAGIGAMIAMGITYICNCFKKKK